MRVTVVDYDATWPRRFAEEAELLTGVLAPWLTGVVHHIGSTAVPGLAAKPILDMMAGVRDLRAAGAAIEPLAAHGYRHAPHRPEAHWFHQPADPDAPRTHQLHLTEPGSDLWRERLAFRDALRADPSLVAAYEGLKQRRGAAYTRGKRALVADVLAAAGVRLGGGVVGDVALHVEGGEITDERAGDWSCAAVESWVYLWTGRSREILYVGATGLPLVSRIWLHLHDPDPGRGRLLARLPGARSERMDVAGWRLDPGVLRRDVRAAVVSGLDDAGLLGRRYVGEPASDRPVSPAAASVAADVVLRIRSRLAA